MIQVNPGEKRKNHVMRMARTTNKVEFSCLDYFIEDMRHSGINTLRIDLFDSVQQTELSFVYYVTLTLYVTSQSNRRDTIFEYAEEVASSTNTEPRCDDEAALHQGKTRLAQVKEQLEEAGFEVLHGRYVEIV